MGYRSQNNLDAAEREALKRLPLRERYDWRLIVAGLLVIAVFTAGLLVRFYVATPDPVPICGAASTPAGSAGPRVQQHAAPALLKGGLQCLDAGRGEARQF